MLDPLFIPRLQPCFAGPGLLDPLLGFKSFGAFLPRKYAPQSMVFSAAGPIGYDILFRHVEALFGGLTPRNMGEEAVARYAGGVAAPAKSFGQSHLPIGFPSVSLHDESDMLGQREWHF